MQYTDFTTEKHVQDNLLYSAPHAALYHPEDEFGDEGAEEFDDDALNDEEFGLDDEDFDKDEDLDDAEFEEGFEDDLDFGDEEDEEFIGEDSDEDL